MARTSSDRITLLITESNGIYCQLFASAMANSPYHIQVVAWAVDTAGVLDAVRQFDPDLALIASQLQGGPKEGFRALASIRKLQSKTRVVMLLNSTDDAQVIDAFRGGARGVFLRSSSIEHLPKCLWSVCRGQVWAGSRELELVLEMLARALPLHLTNSQRAPVLTKREE